MKKLLDPRGHRGSHGHRSVWRGKRRQQLGDRRDAGNERTDRLGERRRRRGPRSRGFERSGPVRIRPGGRRPGHVHRCLPVVLDAADGQGRRRPHGSVPGGKLGVITRPDGGKQVTFDGKPVYSFTQEGPGEVTGDGFMDAFDGQQFTWNVVTVGGSGGSSSAASNASTQFSY